MTTRHRLALIVISGILFVAMFGTFIYIADYYIK